MLIFARPEEFGRARIVATQGDTAVAGGDLPMCVDLESSRFEPLLCERADVVIQPGGVTVQEKTEYARLIDAPPQRDITAQRFAPLEVK